MTQLESEPSNFEQVGRILSCLKSRSDSLLEKENCCAAKPCTELILQCCYCIFFIQTILPTAVSHLTCIQGPQLLFLSSFWCIAACTPPPTSKKKDYRITCLPAYMNMYLQLRFMERVQIFISRITDGIFLIVFNFSDYFHPASPSLPSYFCYGQEVLLLLLVLYKAQYLCWWNVQFLSPLYSR